MFVILGLIALWLGARVPLGLPDLLGANDRLGLGDPLAAAVLLACGSLSLWHAHELFGLDKQHPRERHRRALFVAMAALAATILAIFWGTTVSSERSGIRLAEYINQHPESQAAVVVYSTDELSLWSDGPIHASVSEPPKKYPYRYAGLRLLSYSNERWLLLTGERTSSGRLKVAILRDVEDVRVELSSG
jgi:hypothetical protein